MSDSAQPSTAAPDVCYAFLVRHGATPASAAKPVIMQGRHADVPLSPTGHRQAEETAHFFATRPLAAIYVSPMTRARQTATAIATPHKLEPTPVEALIEADLGTWEGLDWGAIERRDPVAYRQFLERPDLFGYGGGESMTDLRDRAAPAIRDIMSLHRGQVIAIVTHRIVIRACACHFLGVPLAEARRLSPSTCGLTLIELGKKEIELVTFNSLFHLSEW